MRFFTPQIYSLLCGLACACAFLFLSNVDAHGAITSVSNSFQRPQSWALSRRQIQQPDCGVQAGGAVCDPQLCCSKDGFCGAGPSYCASPDCQFHYSSACDANQAPPGDDISQVPRPKFGKLAYGVKLQHCLEPGKVALTFDGSPTTWSQSLLKTLYQRGAKATFFITGNNGGKGMITRKDTPFPDIIRTMHDRGHQIGSQGWSGEDWTRLSDDEITNEILFNEKALAEILGFFPTYFRPPQEGCYKECMSALETLGYHVIGSELDTKDLKEDATLSKNTFQSTIGSHEPSTKGWLVLGHDFNEFTTVDVAAYWIDEAVRLGYEVTTLGDCLGDKKHNWYRNAKTGDRWKTQKEIEDDEDKKPADDVPTPVTTVYETPTGLIDGDESSTHTSPQSSFAVRGDEARSPTSSVADESSAPIITLKRAFVHKTFWALMAYVGLGVMGWWGF